MFKFNVLVFFVLVSSRYINGQVENLIGLPVEYNADDDLDSQINNDIWSNDDHLNLEDDYPAKLLLTLCKKYYLELNNELVDCESINLIPKSLRHTLNKREASEDNLEEGSGAEPPVEPENPEESQAVVETAVEEESKTPEQSPAKEETKPAEETAAEEESKPAEATEEESKPAEAAEEESKPAEATEEESKPAEAAEEESKPAEATEEESKPAEAAEEESKPAEATEEESKPAEVAEEESKPTEAAEEESKRAEATEEESKPIEAAEEELKPAEATEEESKPAEAAEEESKPTEAAEEESKTPEETAITEETPSELEVVPSEGPVQPLEENKETPAETKESEGKEETGGPAFKQQSLVIPDIVESDKLKEEPSQTPDENLETPTDSNPTETKEKENPGSDTIEIGKEKGQEEAKKDETQNKEEVQINQSGITAVKDGGSMSETENKLNSMKPNEKLKTIATAGEEPKSGASESDDLGRKDNKLLIILFVAVLAIGAAAFTYNFIRKRKRNATAARTPAQNGTPVADPEQGREMKPLMKSPEQSNSVEYKDEK